MSNRYTNLFRFFFAVMDLFALNTVHLSLMIIMKKVRDFNPDSNDYTVLFMVSNMVWLASAYFCTLYINDQRFNFDRFFKRTLQSFALFVCLVLFFLFLYQFPYSRPFVLLNFVGFGFTLFLSRIFLISSAHFLMRQEIVSKKIVLLGYNDVSKRLAEYFTNTNKAVSVDGFFEDDDQVKELTHLPVLGNVSECIPYAIKSKVSEIYSTLSPEKHDFIYEFAQNAENHFIRFKFVPDFRMFVNRNIHVDLVDDIPILSLRSEPLEDLAGRIKKRLFDIVFSIFIFVFVLSWLLPIIAILIKLDSKGPVFFKQYRSGKNNEPFICYKFRSLRMNKEADAKQVTANDHRYTRIGKFLRKSNLDEFPQFFNVFLGHMSVVGPRPHMLKHTEDFSRILNEYMIRHFVKPGVTGWAQVKGFRGEIKENEQLRKRIEHDIWYMENWSLFLDIKIIFLTIYTTLKGDKNAY